MAVGQKPKPSPANDVTWRKTFGSPATRSGRAEGGVAHTHTHTHCIGFLYFLFYPFTRNFFPVFFTLSWSFIFMRLSLSLSFAFSSFFFVDCIQNLCCVYVCVCVDGRQMGVVGVCVGSLGG